jgi:hypothetical protein
VGGSRGRLPQSQVHFGKGIVPYSSVIISLIENVSICVRVLSVGTLEVLCFPSNKHCPARCASAANVAAVGKELDTFAVGDVSLKPIL